MFTQEEFDEWAKETRVDYLRHADRLINEGHFVATSTHRNWRGKVRCKYCKAAGWGGSVEKNPYWWGQRHGPNCKHRS